MRQRSESQGSALSLRRQTPGWKPRLLATATAGILAAALVWGGEILLQLCSHDPGIAAMQAAKASGQPFDSRSRMKVVEDLRAQGIPAVPRLVPAAMLEEGDEGVQRSVVELDGVEFLPLAGISNQTTVLCNETGEYAIYESDEHGFRNPLGLWTSTPADLVLIGDSFTIGECVASGETLADRLRADWPSTINLGYSGNSPLFELATLAEYGPMLKPRITLWFYFENDLSWFDLGRSARSPLLMRYLEPTFSQSLVNRQPAIDLRLRALIDAGLAQPNDAGPIQREDAIRENFRKRFIDFLSLVRTRGALAGLRERTQSSSDDPDYRLFGKILGMARDHATTWNGEIVIVYLPGVWNFTPRNEKPNWLGWDARESIRDQADSLSLRFVDMKQAFENHADPLSLYSFPGESRIGSPHMNAAGYEFTATVVRDFLQR